MAKMNRQQKLEASLMQTFTRVLVVVLISVLVAIGIKQMLANVQVFHNENLKQEVQRLKHVIQVLHNQWLIKGKPNKLEVTWSKLAENMSDIEIAATNNKTEIQFNAQGVPQLKTKDNQGCEQLWQALMAADSKLLNIQAEYEQQHDVCLFRQQLKADEEQLLGEIHYQMNTGQVDYLETQTE